jgi:hypothetical protein
MRRIVHGATQMGIVAVLVLLASTALAQVNSSIAGMVRDESGGVLPGVTVEAASPALIEKVRSVATDERGRYRFADLRPGTYRVTFTLPGFGTVVRDGVELQSNFTATVNADLKVGTLQETVTVSGAAPVVDVQQVSRTQTISRDTIDSLPVSRNVMSIGMLVPGVRQGTPDVGGSRTTEQVSLRAHGTAQREMSQLVEGMSIMSYENGSMSYFDDALQAEANVTTSAIPADTSAGGLRLNSILKDGGNMWSGAIFLGGTDGKWQSDNVDDELRSQGIGAANKTAHIQMFTLAMGGPIKRDRFWWYLSIRHQSSDEIVANVPAKIFLPDGTLIRGVVDNYVRGPSVRLTWQATQKIKVTGFEERWFKRKGKDFSYGSDPRAATQRNPRNAHHQVGNWRTTYIPSSKWLLEVAEAWTVFDWKGGNQPGTSFENERYSANWYAYARKTDTALNTNFYPQCAFETGCLAWMSNGSDQRWMNTRHVFLGAVSYVTGTHNLKVGFSDDFGPYRYFYERNGDLVANWVNNRPQTVTVYNTPGIPISRTDYDLGVFVQDSWTIKRLTLNPGLRIEWFQASTRDSSAPAGRFVPARFFSGRSGLAQFGPDYAPRLSAAYDLFGDGKTALKASVSKYHSQLTGLMADRYNEMANLTDTRNWFDADLIPGTSTRSGVVLATNGDGIAQDNEIGPSGNAKFGQRADRNPDPNLERQYNWEYTASMQHQFSFAAVGIMYYKRIWSNLEITDRSLITKADYTSFTTPMPSFANDPTLTGVLDPNEILKIYNLNSAKRSDYGVGLIDKNSDDQSIFTGVELNVTSRLPRGSLQGSWNMERNVSVFCTSNNNPNGPSRSDLYQGWSVSDGGRFCDWRQFDIPFRHEFKVSGSYPVMNVIDVGVVFQSYPGQNRTITWTPPASLFPGGRTNSETIILTEPGELYYPRFNQLDINFRKNWRSGRKMFTLQLDLFNALNNNVVTGRNSVIGGSLGDVSSILMGRLPRIAFQMKW